MGVEAFLQLVDLPLARLWVEARQLVAEGERRPDGPVWRNLQGVGTRIRVGVRGHRAPGSAKHAAQRQISVRDVEYRSLASRNTRVEAIELVLGHVDGVDGAAGVHGEIVLHRRGVSEHPLFDARVRNRRRQLGHEAGLVHAGSQSRDRGIQCVGLVEERGNPSPQVGGESAAHAPHQRENLLPLFLGALHPGGPVTLLMAVGALSDQLLALRRVFDAFQQQGVPAVGGELRGDGCRVRLAFHRDVQRLRHSGTGVGLVEEIDVLPPDVSRPDLPRTAAG